MRNEMEPPACGHSNPSGLHLSAMTINSLIASPGFEVWTQGEPLDVASFFRTRAGKPRVSIFSIAHLDDSQP